MAEGKSGGSSLKQRFLNAWLGPSEGPADPQLREGIKKAAVVATAIAIGGPETLAEVAGATTGGELAGFKQGAPEFRNNPAYQGLMRPAVCNFEDSAVFSAEKDPYRPWGYLVLGDSLAWGLTEHYNERGQIIVDPSQIQTCPTQVVCDAMNKVPPKMEGVPLNLEAALYAYPGATIEDIQAQIRRFDGHIHAVDKAGSVPPPIGADIILAVGGNDALNFLTSNLLDPAFPAFFVHDFLPRFRGNVKKLLDTLLQQREDPAYGVVYANMKHIIVSGIPDLGKSDALYVLPDLKNVKDVSQIPPSTRINMDTPGLRDIATAASKYLNTAIIEALAQAQGEHPDFPILFEDIFDVPVHGIHPTKEGYEQIARKREERLRGKFPPHNEEMSFAQFLHPAA